MRVANTRKWIVSALNRTLVLYARNGQGAFEVAARIASDSAVASVACDPSEEYCLVGGSDGALRIVVYGDIGPCAHSGPEAALEGLSRVLSRFSLPVSSVFIHDELIYAGSENGLIRVMRLVATYGAAECAAGGCAPSPPGEKHRLDDADDMAAVLEESQSYYDTQLHSDQLDGNQSAADEGAGEAVALSLRGKSVRAEVVKEIRHTTPVVDIASNGKEVFVLDMKRRVMVFPSGIVYDNISSIYFNTYLFSVEHNVLYAKTPDAFGSVYASEGPIRMVRGTRRGGYLFALTCSGSIEVLRMSRAGAHLVKRVRGSGDAFVIDEEGSAAHVFCASTFARAGAELETLALALGDIAERKMERLAFRKREIEEIHVDEEEDECREISAAKPYYSTELNFKSVPKHAPGQAARKDADSEEARDEEIEGLFGGEVPCPARGEARSSGDAQMKYGAYVYNGVVGPVSSPFFEKSSLSFWDHVCYIVTLERADCNELEIVNRENTASVCLVRDFERCPKICASRNILLLVDKRSVRVYVGAEGDFQGEAYRISAGAAPHEVKYAVCGDSFVAAIFGFLGGLDVLRIYNREGVEVFCSVVPGVCGAHAQGDSLALLTRNGGGEIDATLYRISSAACLVGKDAVQGRRADAELGGGPPLEIVSRAALAFPEVDFLFVTAEGVVFVESMHRMFALGVNQVVPVSGDLQGNRNVPVAVIANYIVYLQIDPATGRPILFPSVVVDYSRISLASLGVADSGEWILQNMKRLLQAPKGAPAHCQKADEELASSPVVEAPGLDSFVDAISFEDYENTSSANAPPSGPARLAESAGADSCIKTMKINPFKRKC